MAVIPRASSSAIASGSTTSHARRLEFRSRGWPPPRPRSRSAAPSAPSRTCSVAAHTSCGIFSRDARPLLAEIVFDANRGDGNLADPVVAQNLELDDLARVMVVDRLVERAAVVNLLLVGGQHHIALLEPGLLARASRHHTRDHHVLAQRVRQHA